MLAVPSSHQAELSKHLQAQTQEEPLLPQSTSYEGFLKELKASLDRHMLPVRTIQWIFSNESEIHPKCNGDWMEFGVSPGHFQPGNSKMLQFNAVFTQASSSLCVFNAGFKQCHCEASRCPAAMQSILSSDLLQSNQPQR